MKKILDFISNMFKKKQPIFKENLVFSNYSQRENIEKHLIHFGTIDDKKARALYGIKSLPKVIYKLRKKGMKIETYSKKIKRHRNTCLKSTTYIYLTR